MKRNQICRLTIFIHCAAFALNACTNAFLEEKPDRALVVPVTLADFSAILDNSNDQAFNQTPTLIEWVCDDFYINDEYLQLIYNNHVRKVYKYDWGTDLYEGADVEDWDLIYRAILLSNIVLDGLANVSSTENESEYRRIKGEALFHRSYAFFNLAQQFAAPYDSLIATSVPGIPLRLTADINLISGRGTLQQTYDRIATDMLAAVKLLPNEVSYKTRPTKPAAYAFLARFYLSMGDYTKAKDAADNSLELYPFLWDFNKLDSTLLWTFPDPIASLRPAMTDEIIFYSKMIRGGNGLNQSFGSVDTTLLSTYSFHDLRPACLFRSNDAFTGKYLKGSYAGSRSLFSGLATDEIYLIRAECHARAGQIQSAMDDLNTLLEKRLQTEHFVPLTADDSEAALVIILNERRKELLGRGLRWQDLRRLNQDPKYAHTLSRVANGITYFLPPGDKKYVFPIPDAETNISGIEQNQ